MPKKTSTKKSSSNQSYTFSSGGQSYVATPNAGATKEQKAAVASNSSYKPITSSDMGNSDVSKALKTAQGIAATKTGIPSTPQSPISPLSVNSYKDNPDGTTTNTLSDGSTDTGTYSNNPNGSLSFNPQVNTAQPSPATAQVTPPNAQPTSIGEQTKAAVASVKQTGVAAPSSMGQAATTVNQAMRTVTPPPESPSIIGNVMQTDSNFDAILTQYDDFFSPPKQKQSLLKEYQQMSKALGIQDINEELIDAKRIIEGTEDDIRSEITSAGGFASDSQVQAMANGRNKSLIKNYNYLLDSRDSAMTQLNTMMDLSMKDREMAQAEFDRKLNFTFKVQEFKERATNNARSTYMSLGDKMGWDTLLTSVSPYEKSVLQKTLGLSDQALNNLALSSQQARAQTMSENALDLQMKGEQIKTERLQQKNIQSQIDERNTPPVGGVDDQTMAKIQSAPEYKTITGVLPAMTAVRKYLDAVNDTGSFEHLNGDKAGNLKSSYGNAIAAWKTLAALGALSGADFGLAENVIPEPTLFTRNSKVKAQLQSAVDNAVAQGEVMTRRLSQNYPAGSNLFETQLDDMKVTAYPDKFTRNPKTGEVIEITN